MYKCGTIICNTCHKQLPINCFYQHDRLYPNGRVYHKINHKCKLCTSSSRAERYQNNKEHENKLRVENRRKARQREMMLEYSYGEYEEQQKTEKPVVMEIPKYYWVIRNLKNYGNCYIKHINRINQEQLELELGCELNIRKTSKENEGYILEIKKGA